MTTEDDTMTTLRNEMMLIRAGVMKREDSDDYRAHPNRWAHEVASCAKLEEMMLVAGIDPAEGWGMPAREIMQRLAALPTAGRKLADFKVTAPGARQS
jgi:hypothetical protein